MVMNNCYEQLSMALNNGEKSEIKETEMTVVKSLRFQCLSFLVKHHRYFVRVFSVPYHHNLIIIYNLTNMSNQPTQAKAKSKKRVSVSPALLANFDDDSQWATSSNPATLQIMQEHV